MSGLQSARLYRPKIDPAWQHCEMINSENSVHLKCLYCGKIFKGGGIHRIKEHLAGRKGNAAICLKVERDVRLLMQESFNNVSGKSRKKQKLAIEMSNFSNSIAEVDTFSSPCGLNTEAHELPMPDTLGQNSNLLVNQEVASKKCRGRKRKENVRRAVGSTNPHSVLSNNVVTPINVVPPTILNNVPSNDFVTPTNVVSPTTLNNVLLDNVVAPINHDNVPSNNVVATVSKKANDQVLMAIGRFFYEVGVPLNAVNSMYFQHMIDAIASTEPGFVGPSCHDLRGWVLKNSAEEVRSDVDQFMGTWGISGCSVLVDEWILENSRTFINFLVYCPIGTMFLRSVDISEILNSVDAIFNLLKEVVEEVGVRNVLQVITSNEERYALAGKRLTDTFPGVFWTPCAANCIDLILNDFRKLEWISSILEQAKSISRFIYNHSVVINMMRRYTFGIDLVDVGLTCSATDFATLKRMVNIKNNLQSMVTSEEWMESPYSKKPVGVSMVNYINSHSFWSSCFLITRLTDPLLRLLRIVSSKKRPAMGYVYAGIYRAKETIKKELAGKKDYAAYWDIIDHRWERLQRHPLHAAGFYLNPKFFYSTEEDLRLRIRSVVYDCIEKLIPDPKIQDKIVKETTLYQSATGDFGRKMAIRARDTVFADEWWSMYGGSCPNLARLAIRILSQTCSLIGWKPNRTPVLVQQINNTKSSLEHQRLNDLVFVHYNFQLRQMVRQKKEQETVDPIAHDHISMVEDWVSDESWSEEDRTSSDWVSVDPPFGNTTLLGSQVNDDVEALGTGFADYEIFGMRSYED